jgi:hypothetical protein
MTVVHLADIDFSRSFVDHVSAHMQVALEAANPAPAAPATCARLRTEAASCVQAIAARHTVDNLNRIKPGIAEATRAVLRRRPKKVFLRDAGDLDLAALVHLCTTDGIEMEVDPAVTGPYRAITLIEKVT